MSVRRGLRLGAMLLLAALAGGAATGAEKTNVYPTAIFPFEEKGSGLEGYGGKISDVLFARLAARADLFLVDRAEIAKLIDEHELNLSGMVGPTQATQAGQLTGAKILVTGSVTEVDETLYIVAKIIGTETSRVLGQSVKGRASDEIPPLVEELADMIAETITSRANELVAKKATVDDRIAAVNEALGGAERPTVFIDISERHVGDARIDPASRTEIAMFCEKTGFDVIDPKLAGRKEADIIIRGEGFSEFATRHGELVSVKARLEVEAADQRTGKVIASDRQTAVVVDLAEQLAGKAALQEAAAAVAERLLPKLVR